MSVYCHLFTSLPFDVQENRGLQNIYIADLKKSPSYCFVLNLKQ